MTEKKMQKMMRRRSRFTLVSSCVLVSLLLLLLLPPPLPPLQVNYICSYLRLYGRNNEMQDAAHLVMFRGENKNPQSAPSVEHQCQKIRKNCWFHWDRIAFNLMHLNASIRFQKRIEKVPEKSQVATSRDVTARFIPSRSWWTLQWTISI